MLFDCFYQSSKAKPLFLLIPLLFDNCFEDYNGDGRTTELLFMYNSLIGGYSSAGHGGDTILLYIEMVVAGIVPGKFTFPFLLSSCRVLWGIQAHGVVVKMGLEGDVFIGNSLVQFYSECGKIDYAWKMFDGMLERNVVSWNSLICGYAGRGCPEEAPENWF
jgi:pentatricopeptide repeat protein